MKHIAFSSLLFAVLFAGCGGQTETVEPVIDYVPQVKVLCDTVESCVRDQASDDVATKMHAGKWLTQNDLMTQATNRGLHTKNAGFEQQLTYYRNRVKFCDDVSAAKGQCLDINSPDVPERIREILIAESQGKTRDYVKEWSE